MPPPWPPPALPPVPPPLPRPPAPPRPPLPSPPNSPPPKDVTFAPASDAAEIARRLVRPIQIPLGAPIILRISDASLRHAEAAASTWRQHSSYLGALVPLADGDCRRAPEALLAALLGGEAVHEVAGGELTHEMAATRQQPHDSSLDGSLPGDEMSTEWRSTLRVHMLTRGPHMLCIAPRGKGASLVARDAGTLDSGSVPARSSEGADGRGQHFERVMGARIDVVDDAMINDASHSHGGAVQEHDIKHGGGPDLTGQPGSAQPGARPGALLEGQGASSRLHGEPARTGAAVHQEARVEDEAGSLMTDEQNVTSWVAFALCGALFGASVSYCCKGRGATSPRPMKALLHSGGASCHEQRLRWSLHSSPVYSHLTTRAEPIDAPDELDAFDVDGDMSCDMSYAPQQHENDDARLMRQPVSSQAHGLPLQSRGDTRHATYNRTYKENTAAQPPSQPPLKGSASPSASLGRSVGFSISAAPSNAAARTHCFHPVRPIEGCPANAMQGRHGGSAFSLVAGSRTGENCSLASAYMYGSRRHEGAEERR